MLLLSLISQATRKIWRCKVSRLAEIAGKMKIKEPLPDEEVMPM